MLQVSKQAADLIVQLVGDAELPADAGLRLAQRDDHTALHMAITPAPAEDDAVVVQDEATVFIAPIAAERTQGQTLDAEVTPERRAFYLRP